MDFFGAINDHVLEEKAFKKDAIVRYAQSNFEDDSMTRFFRIFITLLDMVSHNHVPDLLSSFERAFGSSSYCITLLFVDSLMRRMAPIDECDEEEVKRVWCECMLSDEGADVAQSFELLAKLVAHSSLRYWEYEREGTVVRKYDTHYVTYFLERVGHLPLVTDRVLFSLFSIHTLLIRRDIASHPDRHFTLHTPRHPRASRTAHHCMRLLWFQFYLPTVVAHYSRFAANKTMRTKMKRSMRNVERVGVGRLLA